MGRAKGATVNILYCGVYRDGGSGYGNAATQTILALDEAGANVACRPVSFDGKYSPTHPRVAELERNSFSHYDVVIQHVPPYAFDYDGRIPLNVGIFYTETDPLPRSWARRADCMDLLLVPCDDNRMSLLNGGVSKPVEILPVPLDLEKYGGEKREVELVSKYKQGRFLFYTIGELTRRKNIAGLLRAFHSEFQPWEQVGLVIKCGIAGAKKDDVLGQAQKVTVEVKRNLQIYPTEDHYIRECIVADRLSDEEILGLHEQCDCFVQPSYGESWSLPAADAMALGRTPIVSDSGGYRHYVTEETGWLIPTREEAVFGGGLTHAELFTGRQKWKNPDLLALQDAMRDAYGDDFLRKQKASRGLEHARNLSRACVGRLLLEKLVRHVKRVPLVR